MIRSLALLTAAAVGSSLLAQSQVLNINPTGPAYGWNPPPTTGQNFFDLTVTNQITLQAIDVPVFNPVGTVGTIQIWVTNPGTTTFVGNEVNPSVWSLQTSGAIVAKGSVGGLATLSATSCQMAIAGGGLVLNPGSYGIAVRYLNVAPAFVAITGVPTFSDANLTVTGGTTQYTAFASAPPGPATGYTGWNLWGALRYAVGAVAHACAENSNYGNGCYTVNGSAYQEFVTAPAAQAALQGRALTFTPAGTGYVMTQGPGALFPPIAPTQLPAVDNGEATITMTIPLNYPGGTTNQLWVHSNGFVSVGPNNTIPGGLNNVPEIPSMLAATNAAWWAWRNYNPAEAGSGLIDWEEDQSVPVVTITYRDVEAYPTTAVNRSTFQFQIYPVTGVVTIFFQTIGAGGSGVLQYDDTLIGFSPGGPSPQVGGFNITTLAPMLLEFPEKFPLKLDASAKPVLGTTITLDTTRETNPNLGINFLSVVQIPAPGFDLAIVGAPGCAALVDINAGVGNIISNLGGPLSMSITLPLPLTPALAGALVFSQSIWLDPAANALGLLTSDAVSLLLGNF